MTAMDRDLPQNEDAGKTGWFARLKAGLARSSSKLSGGITDIFTKRKLDDAALEELEELLIGADLGPATAAKLSRCRANSGAGLTPAIRYT